MYHFVASCHPDPLVLSERVQVPRHIRQYLREFQVEAVQFLYKQFANGDFCILNDESGLGKCVTSTVFLGAIAKLKRCLIVVQNDDEFVTGWQFHLNILTNLSVATLEANNGELNPVPNVTIAKWATLRSIGDTSKYNFEFIVIDNRGEMLSNNFCMSMLLQNYENKVNLLVSSVDVTSDLKLLYNALRLGGRLEHQYTHFKAFETKYKLPNAKDVLNKEISLEEYFLRREMLSNYCKEFRLRRYAHQYEENLPFVDLDRYKISLDLWRTIGSSGSIQNANEITHSDTPTEELFENELALISEMSRAEEVRTPIDDHVNKDMTDDLVTMSPLLVDSESCTSDEVESLSPTEPNKRISHNTQSDVYEFVDLSTEDDIPRYNNANGKRNEKVQRRVEHVKVDENVIVIEESNIRLTQNTEPQESNREKEQSNMEANSAIEKESCENIKRKNSANSKTHKDISDSIQNTNENEKTQRITRSSGKTDSNDNIGRRTKSKAKGITNQKRYNSLKHRISEEKQKQDVILTRQLRRTKGNLTASDFQGLKRKSNENKNDKVQEKMQKATTNISVNQIITKERKRTNDLDKAKKDVSTVRNEPQLNTANDKKSTKSPIEENIKEKITEKTSVPRSEKTKARRRERHEELPCLIRNTRGMQRITRSFESTRVNKYMNPLPMLRTDRRVKKMKKAISKEEIKENTIVSEEKQSTNDKNTKKVNRKTEINSTTKKDNIPKDKSNEISILSFSDCEEMQCGQKLVSDTNVEQNIKDGFLVPPTPPRITRQQESNRVYLPTPSSICESDVIFVPLSGVSRSKQHIVHITSSPDEGSLSSNSSQSRRTRALKQNRVTNTLSTRTNNIEQPLPTFGELLSKQQQKEQIQNQRKSPDIFTASTDLGLTCTQKLGINVSQPSSNTFQGFKIFGSEVKQFQQQHALTPANSTSKQTLNRSCLNILEKMFEPASNRNNGTLKAKNNGNATTKLLTSPTQHPSPHQRTPAVNLVKRNTRQKQMVVPSLPNANINLLTQDVKNNSIKHNKATMTNESRPIMEEEIFEITNNDAFGSLMRVSSNGEISPVQSGKSTQNGQHNKITNYLTQRLPIETQIDAEQRTPKKRVQQQYTGSATVSIATPSIRKSPKQTKTTQTTKLTKWFQKNGNQTAKLTNVLAEKKAPTVASSPSTPTRKQTRSTVTKELRKK